jgi:TatA/E family protein of Tat protein translocase
MFDIGLQELVVIFVIALLVFGPKNLPQLGRAIGRAMREFRRASDEFRSTIETNFQINEPDLLPATAPEPEPLEPLPAGTASADALTDAALDPHAVEPAAIDVGEPFVAQRGGKLFHGRECGWVRRIPEPDRTCFKRVAEAGEAGFLPCPSCEPWEPA